ncbi:MAG TPA: hypothetical protein PLY87_09520 [Planctomycetaceae bacterium]|nr:hypothetical protein [Planctomycetaceae bacterium]
MRITVFLSALLALFQVAYAQSPDASIRIVRIQPDPYGSPRPFPGEKDVPLRTSFFFELSLRNAAAGDQIQLESISVQLRAQNGAATPVIEPGRVFAKGYWGSIRETPGQAGGVSVWFDSSKTLKPLTTYTLTVSARSEKSVELAGGAGAYQFATEAPAGVHPLSLALDMSASPGVQWAQGGFFSGICSPCVNPGFMESWKMMKAAQDKYPRTWSLQRCGGISGPERQPHIFWEGVNHNVSRSLETRRISAMELGQSGTLLRLEDLFGHEQYDIASHRPLSEDYQPGYEVVITDGVISTRTLVLSVDDAAGTALVTSFGPEPSKWKIAYSGPLPSEPHPLAPGLFAPGGCYLQRIRPLSKPMYYWGRIDAEFDRVHREFGRRLVVNFLDVPGDLSIDGLDGYTPADYPQLHESIREISAHIIERYGDDSYEFYWSVFNEPDLKSPEVRSEEGWNSLQVFYDYAVDGILRAFEDAGMDSSRVIIGGIELGGIWRTHLRATEFLAHCSPVAEHPKAVLKNAAYADPALAGKRSRLVEHLCGAHEGKGSPMNFLSVHAYNNAEIVAAKLITAKKTALDLDPEYYRDLCVTTFETAPNWGFPPEPAPHNSLLGNGYFSTWCAEVSQRQMRQASEDPRYARTDHTITRWMFPIGNFSGLNEVVQVLSVDDNGDGIRDRDVSVPMPVFHFATLLNSMDQNYRLLPETVVGGHRVAGFASSAGGEMRLLLYTHNSRDIESRSGTSFNVALDLSGLPWRKADVEAYQIDSEHNSVYPLAREISNRLHYPADKPSVGKPGKTIALKDLGLPDLANADLATKMGTLRQIEALAPESQKAAVPVLFVLAQSEDEALRTAAGDLLKIVVALSGTLGSPKTVTAKEAAQALELSQLRPTLQRPGLALEQGRLQLNLPLLSNGVQFVIISGE